MRGWEASPSNATVLIATGFSEHGGRYEALGNFLAGRGYTTFVYDARGHGKSSGPPGHTPNWNQLVDDLGRVSQAVSSRADSSKTFLMGTSMGGLVALDWMLENPDSFSGLVLVSPFLSAAFEPPSWRVNLARVATRLYPKLAQPHNLRGKDLTSDPDQAQAYDSDQDIQRVMSAGYFHSFRGAQDRLKGSGPRVNFPVLVLYAGRDRIASPQAIEAWIQTVALDSIHVCTYPDLMHEILNERSNAQVMEDLADGLDQLRAGE